MRIKVGNEWHEATPGRPVMIELTRADKENIANMAKDASRYAEFDEADVSVEQRIAWMDEGAKRA